MRKLQIVGVGRKKRTSSRLGNVSSIYLVCRYRGAIKAWTSEAAEIHRHALVTPYKLIVWGLSGSAGSDSPYGRYLTKVKLK